MTSYNRCSGGPSAYMKARTTHCNEQFIRSIQKVANFALTRTIALCREKERGGHKLLPAAEELHLEKPHKQVLCPSRQHYVCTVIFRP